MQQTIFTSKYFNDRISLYNIDSIKDLANKKQLINRWITALESGNLSFAKETQIDLTFLTDIFGEVLDYTYEIDKQKINLIPKSSIDSKEPDAILGFFTQQDRRDIRVVIELKDSKNDLDRVQNRLEKISPVTQAFEYARKAGENCKWVIVSNIQTIRLYNKESDRYEIFNLIDLKDDFHVKRFFFLLHKDRLLFQSGESYVDILYRERLEEERKIEKEFYANYHSLRTKLFEHIIANNKNIEPSISLEKTQKILDRIIFVCFCADLEIIAKSIPKEVINLSNPSFKYTNDLIWQMLKQLFLTLNFGNNRILKLNGGLFEVDEILNNLKIDDDILTQVLSLTEYDYRSDLNVNILGHIFEQSISDLEKMKRNLQGFGNLEGLAEQNGKRKSYGIFYTPENITKFLVKQTIGNWLEEQKLELGENELPILTDKDYDLIKITKQGTLRTNDNIEKNKLFWSSYLDRLLSIKILDPACGSGAFLVECLNFLITEYRNVQKELRLLNPPIPPVEYKSKLKQELTLGFPKIEFEIEEHILRHNLFGVDINFESVEITKLALWLKTVKRGKVLTDIDYNIKQGNSLIADSQVAGNLAFNWNTKFEKIMKDGGFDVIIGNPPYGALLSENEKKYLADYDSNVPDFEIFYYFITKGCELLNDKGYLGYIFPNTFLSRQFGIKYRQELLKKYSIVSIADLSEDKTFEDANVRTCITVLKNEKTDTLIKFSTYCKNDKTINTTKYLNQSYLEENISNWQTLFSISDEIYSLIQKIRSSDFKINDICEVSQGYIPYRRSDLIKKFGEEQGNKIVDERLWHSETKLNEDYKQEILGRDIKKYFYSERNLYVNYGKHVASYVEMKFFTLPRILIREIAETTLNCAYIEKEFCNSSSMITIIQKDKNYSLKFLLGILNSKLIGWYHFNTSPKAKKGLFPKILVSDVRNIPIPKIKPEEQTKLINLVEKMLSINIEIEKLKSKFINRIASNYNIQKVSNNLSNFNNLSFVELNNELKKNKIQLNFKQQDELEEYFTVNKNQINSLIELKKSVDKQIDNLVFKLYNLTDSDIELIEKQ